MRATISAFALAGLIAIALSGAAAVAADKRVDAGVVNPASPTPMPARRIDDPATAGAPTFDPTGAGRSPFIDDDKPKAPRALEKPGRSADDPKPSKIKKTKRNKASAAAPTN